MEPLKEKYLQMLSFIRQFSSILIAFSGGLDSGFLLFATREAGKIPRNSKEFRLLALTALSPAVPEWDITDAHRIALELGIPHRFLPTDLLNHSDYQENTPQRCYFCKSDLYKRLEEIRQRENYEVIFNGTQADDLQDVRPGLKAAEEYRVVSPLLQYGFTKMEIRSLAKRFGLFFWDKPSSPCLSSRIPHGFPITESSLRRVQKAESALRQLGLKVVRVRDRGTLASLELGPEDLQKVNERNLFPSLHHILSSLGYSRWEIQPYHPAGLSHLSPP